MERLHETRRTVTRLVLGALAPLDFALAGAGALMEHGIVDRPTFDVDAFTTGRGTDLFADARTLVHGVLDSAGWSCELVRSHDEFVTMETRNRTTGAVFAIDLGVDWRARPPVTLSVGPVLAVDDAVSAKLVALCSRREIRDALDVDSIRQFGQYSDADLVAMAGNRDPGFSREVLTSTIVSFTSADAAIAAHYDVAEAEWGQVLTRLSHAFSSLETN